MDEYDSLVKIWKHALQLFACLLSDYHIIIDFCDFFHLLQNHVFQRLVYVNIEASSYDNHDHSYKLFWIFQCILEAEQAMINTHKGQHTVEDRKLQFVIVLNQKVYEKLVV